MRTVPRRSSYARVRVIRLCRRKFSERSQIVGSSVSCIGFVRSCCWLLLLVAVGLWLIPNIKVIELINQFFIVNM
jgi:hypothetical protein